MNDLYQEIILDHYKHPRNKGFSRREKNQKVVKKTNVGCGDEFSVALQLTEIDQTISNIEWEGQGCAISTASLSLLSEFVKGKTVGEVLALKQDDLLELLGLDEINPGREKCSLLGLLAIQNLVR